MNILLFFLISNLTFQQSPCVKGCLKCISEQKCLYCDLNNSYILQSGECILKSFDLCSQMDIYGNCILCKKDHYLDETTKKCVAIQQEKQIQNCFQYNNENTCISCDANYYLRDNTCISVGSKVENCLYYSGSQQCIECKDNFVLNFEFKCVQSQQCILHTELECLQCKSGYFLNKNYHLQLLFQKSHSNLTPTIQDLFTQQVKIAQKENICQPYIDQNCLIYKNEVDCLECKEGYFLNQNKLCQSYPHSQIANCEEYSSLKICKKCAQKYLLVNSQCVKGEEIPNCVLYQGDSNTQICLSCDYDYYLKGNYCIQRKISLQIENCQTLSPSEDLCLHCEDNFVLSLDQLKCFIRITGCHRNGYGALYSTNNKVVCYQCQDLYYLEEGQCKTGQIQNCLKYTDSKNCSECKDGYYFNQEDQQCQTQGNVKNCRVYSKLVKDACTLCQNLYFNFVIKNECKQFQKIENCIEYSNYDPVTCKQCEQKYSLKNNVCELIELQGCIQLNSNGTLCEICQQGFALREGKCITPPSNAVVNCQKNSTQIQSSSSVDFLQVVCKYCESDSLPIDMKYRYMCMEEEYIDEFTDNVIQDCLKYKNGSCVQCGNNKFLYNGDCITNCTKFIRLYHHVQNHNIFSQNKSNRSGSVSYIRYNRCLSISQSESCEIIQQDVYLEQQGCIKCRAGYYSVFSQTLKSNSSSITDSSLPSYTSFYNYSNVDPNLTQMPFINDIGFVSPFLQCEQFSADDFPVNECRYYYKNDSGEDYTCLSCNKGFVGLIESWKSKNFDTLYDDSTQAFSKQVSKITQCIPYQSIQENQCSELYYTNLEPLWETLFSCHICKIANQIPFLIAKFNSLKDLSNMHYTTYDLNNAEDWSDGDFNHTIQCKEKNPENFGYDPNSNELTDSWFKLPEECAMAVVNLAVNSDLKSNKNLIIEEETSQFLPIFCAACKPGYQPVFYSSNKNNQFFNLQVKRCEEIKNCIGRQWVNSCSKCKTGYAFKMPSMEGDCTQNDDCQYKELECVPVAVQNCFQASPDGQCLICNKGYNINETKMCEKIQPPKCESSENFVIFNMHKNYLSYKYESYLLQEGHGCSLCQEGFKAVYRTNFQINCYQSNILSNFNTQQIVNLDNSITHCEGYTIQATSQTSSEDIYEGSNNQTWIQSSRRQSEYSCEQCKSDTLLSFEKKKCLTGLDFCKVANQNDKCAECADTHALVTKGDLNVCMQGNIENCEGFSAYSNSTNLYCTSCKQGYRFKDNSCIKGQVANCLQYDWTTDEKCLKCQDGFVLLVDLVGKGYCYPIQQNLQCKKGVIKNSSEFGAVFQCTQCAADDQVIKFKDKLETLCMPFTQIENCLSYNTEQQIINSDFQCNNCEEGFYLEENGQCKERENLDPNCDIYSREDRCEKCKEKFYLEDKKCYGYPEGIAGCIQYKDQASCEACKEKMFLFQGTCVDVPVQNLIENCIQYTNASVCQKCENGYFLNSKGSFCYPATAENCLSYRSKTECEVCVDGFGFVEEGELRKCVEMSVDNCSKFKQIDPYECVVCDEGFYLQDGNCQKVIKKITDCHSYLSQNKCQECEEGFILTEQQDQCLSDENLKKFVPDNCEVSKKLDNLACVVCQSGYYFNNQICEQCQAQNCIFCNSLDSTECLLCKSGYYQNDQGDCVSSNGINQEEIIDEITEDLSIKMLSFFALVFLYFN